MADAQKYQILSASYQSPTSAAFTHIEKLPAPPSESPKDRTAYLAALRGAVGELQGKINKELTSRMEEDKAREAAGQKAPTGAAGKGAVIDEAKEEDNYGEEVVEEDS
ncbi:hypothetical protein F5884DRAFT_749928 [Xylogone sp. PMI_703]|nr:hypothetical protein F5884DRAFT_749928 [Xylogone sp. PMI_703]